MGIMKILTVILILLISASLAVALASPLTRGPGLSAVDQAAKADAGPSGAAAATVSRALGYLEGRQKSDGGFAEPGQSSSDHLTTWAVVAIKSTGKDPATWRKSGKSPLDYLAGNAAGWSRLTDIEKGCLAAASAGADPRSFGGRDLVTEIKNRMAADGHIGDMVNEHCWGVIALKAAGEPVPDSARAWLAARQNVDGGFGFSDEVASDPDDTGAALQALVAAGESPDSSTVDRALKYLKFCQSADGGFYWRSTASNIASTAWAVQGIAAAGEDPGSEGWTKGGKTPLDYMTSMQQSDGHIKYMPESDSQPAWMTAEAIPALLKRPYPLNYTPARRGAVGTPAQATQGNQAATAARQAQAQAQSAAASTDVTAGTEAAAASPATDGPGGVTGTPAGVELDGGDTTDGSPAVAQGANNYVKAESGGAGNVVVYSILGASILALLCGIYLVIRARRQRA